MREPVVSGRNRQGPPAIAVASKVVPFKVKRAQGHVSEWGRSCNEIDAAAASPRRGRLGVRARRPPGTHSPRSRTASAAR
eukprot:3993299-Prymnesium_polylepis.1